MFNIKKQKIMSLVVKKRATLPSLVSDLFETGRYFPSVFDIDSSLFDFDRGSMIVPDANIEENEKDYRIDIAAPGLERKDFKVEVDNGVLIVSAEKEEEKKEKRKNYRRREFSYSSFSRSFILPDNSLADKIDAKYENGILHIMLPKKEMTISKPAKQIKIA